MKWTLQKPTLEGWYWFRERNMEPEAVHVGLSRDNTRLEVHSAFRQVNISIPEPAWDGEWFGPLEVPT